MGKWAQVINQDKKFKEHFEKLLNPPQKEKIDINSLAGSPYNAGTDDLVSLKEVG